MSGDLLLFVRLRRGLTALERTLGLLRTQLLESPRFSLTSDASDDLHVLVRVPEGAASPERLVAELEALHDVTAVQVLAPSRAIVREMALARVSAVGVSGLRAEGRVLAEGAVATVVEITGSPEEVDRVLDELRGAGALLGLSRTGALSLCPAGN
jgi:acetolactate synthase small subunit